MSDYQEMLDELGITEQQMQEITQTEWYPCHVFNVSIRKSPIHGDGLFAKFLPADYRILAARDGQKTYAGRFVNHSSEPNACYEQIEDKVYLVPLRNITDEEILIDYRETPGAKAWLKLQNED